MPKIFWAWLLPSQVLRQCYATTVEVLQYQKINYKKKKLNPLKYFEYYIVMVSNIHLVVFANSIMVKLYFDDLEVLHFFTSDCVNEQILLSLMQNYKAL